MILRPSLSRLNHLAHRSHSHLSQSVSLASPLQSCLQQFPTPHHQTPINNTRCRSLNPVPSTRSPHGHQRRKFTTSTSYRAEEMVNHYEILKLTPQATKADLKKQFYKLSKETHPDMHPNDPKAGDLFSQVSESYSVLINEEKRKKYDRDFFRQQQQSGSGGGAGSSMPSGSYAGSRSPTGLSKRRGTFRGPPPSFYSQGGYAGTGRPEPKPGDTSGLGGSPYSAGRSSNNQAGGTFDASAYAEAGKWDPDFNPDFTYRAQKQEDTRRDHRRQAQLDTIQNELAEQDSFWIRFVVVSAILAAAVTIGGIVINMHNSPRGGLTRSDGSRRNGPKNEWAKG